MKTQYSNEVTMTADDIKKLSESIKAKRTTDVNPLGGRLTNTEKKKREKDSHSLIQYDMRDIDETLPPIHIMLGRLSKDSINSVSIPRQESDICDFARMQGYQLDTEEQPGILDVDNSMILKYVENGSASKNKVRPVMDALMDFVKQFDGKNPVHLWIFEWSRLTRREDVAQNIIRTLFERGVVLHIVLSPWIDIRTEQGRDNLYHKVKQAEQEAESTKQRAIYAHNHRAKAGYFRGGRAPLGYSNVVLDGEKHPTLVLNEEQRADYPNSWSEVDLVQMIFAKVMEGNSTSSISRWLNGLNIPTVKGAKGWDNRTVAQVVRNARYAGFQTHKAGKAYWSKFNKDHIVADKDGNFLVSHVALIKPEDFFAANAIMDGRYQKKRKYNSSRLAGIIVCAKCGGKMSLGTGAAHKNGKRYNNYRCQGKTFGLCDTNNIPSIGIEDVVRGIVRSYLADPAKQQTLIAKFDEPVEDSEERKELLALIAEEQAKLVTANKYEKAGISATIRSIQDDLAKMDGGRIARASQAKAAINELAEFDAAWDDDSKRLGLNLAILSVIREIRVQPRAAGDKILNRYELASLGWHCNYNRVELLLADGTEVHLGEAWSQYITPKAA